MKKLLSYEFHFVQNITPVIDRNGNVQEFHPQDKYNKKDQYKLHKYGDGAFCRFSIDPLKWSGVSGIYAYFIDDRLVYIGQALDLAKRFNQGYGYIAPRACYDGGQPTNCKMNKIVLNAINDKKTIELYFCITGDFHRIERDLIGHFNPIYNTALRTDLCFDIKAPSSLSEHIKTKCISSAKSASSIKRITVNPSIHEVRTYIQTLIAAAKSKGVHKINIRSGDVHRALNMDRAMPTVCRAMRTLPGDYKYLILEEPPKGNGSRLVFQYIF